MNHADPKPEAFTASQDLFEALLGYLDGEDAGAAEHADLEDALAERGRELLRQLFQDHLDLRASRERRAARVIDAAGVDRPHVEAGHDRTLSTVFGQVRVVRRAYRRPGQANLHPADGALNLPAERHSHGLRRLAAVEACRGSFQEAGAAVARASGQRLGKRQLEALATRAAGDIEAFYAGRQHHPVEPTDVLVLSADGKGIVMRSDSLRPATAKAAAAATSKLQTRLSKGEKRNRKRLAEVGAVYDLTPVARSPRDVLARHPAAAPPPPAPVAKAKWVTASVVHDAAEVVHRIFDEAERRDPAHHRCWVALVDGNNHQINRIEAEASARGVEVTIVVDLIHVLEYLWGAAWSFFTEADPAAEAWVAARALAVLEGKATTTAAGIRRRATAAKLDKTKRRKADECARYLTNKAAYLDYPTALAAGWPIATGIIEGACRYLVADRMDITGARWSTDGAEAVLKLRAARANHDWTEYWRYHLRQERRRIHQSRYAGGVIPPARAA